MHEYFELLTYIAKKEGLFGSLKTSTLGISKELGISQQTISRKLREMEISGLINRVASPNGLTISIDNKGRGFLQKNYHELSRLFKSRKTAPLCIVEKGIGEGSYYVSQKQYQNQFRAKLGFDAYPGTLNLKINKEELASFLADKEPIKINGFSTKTRSFGSITAYKIKINNIEASLIIPERSRYSGDIIEVIAPVNLRDALKLNDSNNIKLN